MSKTKKLPKVRDTTPKLPSKPVEPAAPAAPWFRETVESIVIAFVLAFLFRTFEAEAFVIPTGSMAPTLMGRHKDVFCTECGRRFQVTASEEESEEALRDGAQNGLRAMAGYECVSGVCPECRYTMPMSANLPRELLARYPAPDVSNHRSYNGDRILVNKYAYTIGDPQRWDVVVFKYPGDAQMNYIKRLVGLPGETLRVYQGDLFVKRARDGANGKFQIERKPAGKVLAMRQQVHDTNYDPTVLYEAGWPLRWSGDESGSWQAQIERDGENVRQQYRVDSAGEGTHWLRYRNFVPDYDVWRELFLADVRAREQGGPPAKLAADSLSGWQPQLVMDFNAYNTRVTRSQAMQSDSLSLDVPGRPDLLARRGVHWVGDLMVEADIDVQEARGDLLLDLVEGGRHFTCTIHLETGEAKLAAGDLPEFAPTAKTILLEPGRYRVGLANVDDQLLLFVKRPSLLFSEFRAGDLVEFDGGTAYDAERVFGDRTRLVPQTSDEDPGDLAPVGVGARGAKLTVNRLQVWRDIYYIADSWRDHLSSSAPISDYRNWDEQVVRELAYNPSLWGRFLDRRSEEFELGADQFFVMGDNSAESSDARLWRNDASGLRGRPGGDYLERRMLIGKALCVYWPHSWNRIPGTPIPFPLFPNFADMRLVR